MTMTNATWATRLGNALDDALTDTGDNRDCAAILAEFRTAQRKGIPDGKRKPDPQIWVGIVDGIFGYGMSVVADSEAAVMKALRAEYRRWKKQYPTDPTTNFDASFENFGGRVTQIEKGKVYYDNFAE